VSTYDLTDDTANILFASPNFLRIYTITTFPSFYFSDQEWRKLRKLVSPAFSSGTLDVYFDVFKNSAEILVQALMKKVGGGEFDVCPYLNLYTLDNIIGEYIKCYVLPFKSFAIYKLCGKWRDWATVVLVSICSVGH
jgi:hypothetical protein